mmetsp:Transcript_13215/g.21891  ORF Transcript_13215/g.21891 Transcript_13215/m.21891 type:complete len:299 (-) Transcript_13215:613-1509(-)
MLRLAGQIRMLDLSHQNSCLESLANRLDIMSSIVMMTGLAKKEDEWLKTLDSKKGRMWISRCMLDFLEQERKERLDDELERRKRSFFMMTMTTTIITRERISQNHQRHGLVLLLLIIHQELNNLVPNVRLPKKMSDLIGGSCTHLGSIRERHERLKPNRGRGWKVEHLGDKFERHDVLMMMMMIVIDERRWSNVAAAAVVLFNVMNSLALRSIQNGSNMVIVVHGISKSTLHFHNDRALLLERRSSTTGSSIVNEDAKVNLFWSQAGGLEVMEASVNGPSLQDCDDAFTNDGRWCIRY